MSQETAAAQNRTVREQCVRFYNQEAELLDNRDLEGWLALLTDEISYSVPVRITREADSGRSVFSEKSYHFNENMNTLSARVERFSKDYAWAENPPSRTRRFVTNVRSTVDDEDIQAKSNILIRRLQGDTADGDIISGERHDVLKQVNGDLKLDSRVVHLDETVIGTKNFSIFL